MELVELVEAHIVDGRIARLHRVDRAAQHRIAERLSRSANQLLREDGRTWGEDGTEGRHAGRGAPREVCGAM